MKLPAGSEKWVVAVLGLVSVLLVGNLVAQFRSMRPRHAAANVTRVSSSRRRAGKVSPRVADDLARYDPVVHFDALKSLDARPFPDEDRNPFEFVGGPVAPVTPTAIAAAAAAAPPPPPPPPPPLKAVGYNELPGGKREAMLTFNDDLSVVHEGDTIGTKFKVVKITPTSVTVEDGDTHQTLDLPFPQ